MPVPDQDFSDRTAAVVRRVEGTPPGGRGHRASRRYFSDQFYPFELTADLTAGSSADANLIEWDSEATEFVTIGDTITVFDDFGISRGGGLTGDQGLFMYVEADRRVIFKIDTLQFYPFELTADLTAGGSTNAKLLKWDATGNSYSTTGDNVTVNDEINSATLGGKTGDQGLFYHAESDYRIISQISTIARQINFTVTGALVAATAEQSCVVTDHFDGSNPGTPQMVQFDMKFEADGGNIGKARLEDDGKYHCLNIDCVT